jgi:hypothetical protein
MRFIPLRRMGFTIRLRRMRFTIRPGESASSIRRTRTTLIAS